MTYECTAQIGAMFFTGEGRSRDQARFALLRELDKSCLFKAGARIDVTYHRIYESGHVEIIHAMMDVDKTHAAMDQANV